MSNCDMCGEPAKWKHPEDGSKLCNECILMIEMKERKTWKKITDTGVYHHFG